MIIGCDIGGVVKEMTSDDPVKNSFKSLNYLINCGHKIIFISKCKENYQKIILEWLKQCNFKYQIFFCNEYSQKTKICIENNVDYMIDDKLLIFKDLPDSIIKIWLCNDNKKIEGAKKYQNDEFNKVKLCVDWEKILLNF